MFVFPLRMIYCTLSPVECPGRRKLILGIGTAAISFIDICRPGKMLNFLLLQPSVCSEYYLLVFSRWQEKMECCHIFKVIILLDLTYYSDVVLRDDDGLPVIWNIAITYCVVIALLCSLAASPEGSISVVCIGPICIAMSQLSLSHCHLVFPMESMISASFQL